MFGRKAIFLVVFPAILASRLGHAEHRLDAKERTARTACLAGDYAKGVQLLSELFVDTMDTTFIYNQGRCFEQNRRYEDAIARFQEYLRAAKKASEAERAEAQRHIADCQDLLVQEKAVQEKAQATPGAAPLAPPFAPTAAATATPNAPPGSSGSGLRTTGIVAAAVGGAGLVAGLIFNLKANSLADDFDRTQDPATKSSQSSYKTGSMVCYGVGAGALIAGTVLYLVGHSASGEEDARVSLVPVLTPTELSLGIHGRL